MQSEVIIATSYGMLTRCIDVNYVLGPEIGSSLLFQYVVCIQWKNFGVDIVYKGDNWMFVLVIPGRWC
jgi:hypothetical protein